MLRRLLAFGIALLAVLAAGPEVVAHSHPSWEPDLARQVTVRPIARVPCAPTHHFDPAELDVHPPCPACLSGRAGVGALAPPATPAVAHRAVAHVPPGAPTRRCAAPLRLAPGRAPPLA
jgi:hypothetical protein